MNSQVKQITRQEYLQLQGANPVPASHSGVAEELEFFQNMVTGRLGVLNRDRTDNDYGYAVLARDAKGLYGAVEFDVSIGSRDKARAQLLSKL